MSIRSSAASPSSTRTKWSRSKSRPTSLPKLSGLALIASLALAAPVAASGGVYCQGKDIVLDVATGHLPVLMILGAHVEAGDTAFSTGPERGDGQPFIVGQAWSDDDVVMIDFTDPGVQDILVSVRLRFGDDEDWPLMGTVTLAGNSHAVRCILG